MNLKKEQSIITYDWFRQEKIWLNAKLQFQVIVKKNYSTV